MTGQRLVTPCEAGEYSVETEDGTDCAECRPGQYTSDSNYATTCSDCATGKYSDENRATKCKECSAGYYSTGALSQCRMCTSGFFQPDTGRGECRECQPGQFTDVLVSQQCKSCPVSTYQNKSAQNFCQECPDGWHQLTPGSSSCKECKSGTYEADHFCQNCNIGDFQDETGQTECKECPTGFSNDMVQSSFCRQCPTDVESTEPLCNGWGLANSTEYVACPAGKYSDTNDLSTNTCLDCPVGQISVKARPTEGYDSCRLCESGTGINEQQTLCVNCPVGLYSDGGVCTTCPPGTFSNGTAVDSCSDCLAGTYSDGTEPTSCASCPRGWSTDGTDGATECSPCPPNTKSHIKQGQCTTSCPSISKLVDGSNNECDTCLEGRQGVNCVSCPSGSFKDVQMSQCSQCPTGFISADDHATCVVCSEGKVPLSHATCVDCGAGKYQSDYICEDCPQGFSQPTPGSGQCVGCSEGTYQNQAGQSSCKNCESGLYQSRAFETTCLTCPNGYVSETTECTLCPTGRGAQNGQCNDCAPGTGSEAGICVECTPGKHSNNVQVCESCGVNTYQDAYGESSCKPCEDNRFSAQGATACSRCAAGKYSLQDNSCVDCMSGQYRGVDDPEDNCITCPIGFKASVVAGDSGTVTCDICPTGQKSIGVTCTDCPPGFFAKVGVCESCPVGYYQEQSGQGSCTMCDTFKVAPVGSVSSTACTRCDSELYNIVVNGICEVCPHGQIYDETSYTHLIENCESCPPGKEVSSKTTCQPCAKNEFSEPGMSCRTCPTGFSTSSTGSAQCAKCIDGDCDGVCPSGGYLSDGLCQNCPSGYVSLGGYQTKCIECSKGTYQPEPNQNKCLLCESGRFSQVGANSICQLCATGQYQQEQGQGDCNDCLPGKYTELKGQTECSFCQLGQFTAMFGSSSSGDCQPCPAGTVGTFSGKCVDCPESTWQDEEGQSDCKDCDSNLVVPYSKSRSTNSSDCFDIDGIVSYVFGMKDDAKVSQTLDASCEIRPNMVLYCPSCTCKSDVRDGYWDGPICDECQRGFAGGQVGKCLIKCPGYDGVHDSTMCNGNGKCWYGKHGSGECLCGGKNVLDSTSDNVVVNVKTCPAGQKCPGYGTEISDTTQYKPLYYLLEYRQYSVFVLQLNTHTPKRGHMWFERYSPQNIYENVCSTCVGKYDKTPSTEIGYFTFNSDYKLFNSDLQLENGFHGENCQYECAACLNNGKCLNTPHTFYYSYTIESVDSVSQPVFLPQTQCVCSSSIYDADAMCCPYGFEPYVYFGKRDVKPYFQYTALPFITNIVNRPTTYWTDEDLWLNTAHVMSYQQSSDNLIAVSNINNIYDPTGPKQVVHQNYEELGPYTKHTFYGTEKDICRACPGLFGKGVKSRTQSLTTASEAEDYWWDSAAMGKKCNGIGVCDFYSQKLQSDVLFMGEYKTENNTKFQLHRRFTSCRDIVNKAVGNNKVEMTECIRQAVDGGASAFVYSEPYTFIYDASTMPKGSSRVNPFKVRLTAAQYNRHGYISTVNSDGDRIYYIVDYGSGAGNLNYVPTPDSNGDYIFHPWNEQDCQIVENNNCYMTETPEYSLYKVGTTGQGDERLAGASFDRFDTCLTYDDGTFKTKIGNYITTTYKNGEDPFLGHHCPKGHFCTKTGTGAEIVGFKEACPPGYFQPDEGLTRTNPDVHCSRLATADPANCDENLATLRTDFVDKKCQKCQPNEYAPEGSSVCTACPVGRVKKLSGGIEENILKNMYNIPVSLDGTYWFYIEDETGFELSDCALVPNGIVHVPEADQFMTSDIPEFLPVFPCPFSYSSRPGTYVIHGHESISSLLATRQNVIVAPFATLDNIANIPSGDIHKDFVKDHCFVCPSSSITGHGSTTCTTCYQDRTAFTAKEVIQSVAELTTSKFPDAYKTRSSGLCTDDRDWGYINNEQDCQEAADLLLLQPIWQNTGSWDYDPPGCIIGPTSRKLYVNEDITAHECGTRNYDCICKNVNISKKYDQGKWTSYDHWINHLDSVPITDKNVVRNHVEGMTINTEGTRTLAEVMGYCNYHFPAYIGVIPNERVEPQNVFKHTCVESVNKCDGNGTDINGWNQKYPGCSGARWSGEGWSPSYCTNYDGVDWLQWYGDCCKWDDSAGCIRKSDEELVDFRQEIYMKLEGSWSTSYPLCEGCPSGKSNRAEVVGQCDVCGVGQYTTSMEDAEKNQCIPCPVGKYTDTEESRFCISCPTGFHQDETGGAACKGCQPGKYMDMTNAEICKNCDAGQYITTPQAVVGCKECHVGEKFVSKTIACKDCQTQTYMDEQGNTGECKTCDRGKYWTSTTTKCKTCPIGQFAKESGGCDDCKPGTYGLDKGKCTLCGKGMYQDSFGKDNCKHCPRGYYGNSDGKDKCTIASKGHLAETLGLAKQTPCVQGTYKKNTGLSTDQYTHGCPNCPSGWINDGAGRTTCRQCAAGDYESQHKKCVDCPNGYFSKTAGSTSCKMCTRKTNNGARNTGCTVSCSKGETMNCDSGESDSPKYCRPGSDDEYYNGLFGQCRSCEYRYRERDCYCKVNNDCAAKWLFSLQ